jgi:hypothetical protein
LCRILSVNAESVNGDFGPIRDVKWCIVGRLGGSMATIDLRAWAVKGAEQRLVEIADEARVIFQIFPELRERGRGFDLPKGSRTGSRPTDSAKPRHRRRKMSAAARNAVSARMKKYWAQRNAKK